MVRAVRLLQAVVLGTSFIGVAPTIGARIDRDSSIVDTIRSLIDRGRYVEAEAEAERLFSTAGTTDDEHLDPRTGDALVEALTSNGRGAEPRTRELAERVIRARVVQFGADDFSLARSFRNLGDVLLQAGEYAAAVARFEQALHLHERHAENSLDVATDLSHLARALIETEQF